MSPIHCILLENMYIKAEEHDISRDSQRFLDSAVIRLDVLNDLKLRTRPIELQLIYVPCSSASKSWPHYEIDLTS